MSREFKPLILDNTYMMPYEEFVEAMRKNRNSKSSPSINSAKDSLFQEFLNEYLKNGVPTFKFNKSCE